MRLGRGDENGEGAAFISRGTKQRNTVISAGRKGEPATLTNLILSEASTVLLPRYHSSLVAFLAPWDLQVKVADFPM